MKRIAAILATSVVVLLGSAGATRADPGSPPMGDGGCGGGYVGGALDAHLRYRSVVWSVGAGPDEGTLHIDAPRGWSFVRTAQAEGRFHDPAGHDLLSLRETAQVATPEEAMSAQVRQLAGTPGLEVLGQHVKIVGSLQQRWATLAYRWTSMGEPRMVKERWIAYGTDPGDQAVMVLTVAGRAMDGHGVDALLAHVTPTAGLAG